MEYSFFEKSSKLHLKIKASHEECEKENIKTAIQDFKKNKGIFADFNITLQEEPASDDSKGFAELTLPLVVITDCRMAGYDDIGKMIRPQIQKFIAQDSTRSTEKFMLEYYLYEAERLIDLTPHEQLKAAIAKFNSKPPSVSELYNDIHYPSCWTMLSDCCRIWSNRNKPSQKGVELNVQNSSDYKQLLS